MTVDRTLVTCCSKNARKWFLILSWSGSRLHSGSLVGLGATKGVFVATSTFSPQAREFVQHLSQRVILLDGQSLADLMIEHGVGVRTSRAIEFKRLDEDFFSEDD